MTLMRRVTMRGGEGWILVGREKWDREGEAYRGGKEMRSEGKEGRGERKEIYENFSWSLVRERGRKKREEFDSSPTVTAGGTT